MKEINLLPGDLLQMPSVLTLQDWYAQSFKELIEFEEKSGKDPETLTKFCQALKTVQVKLVELVHIKTYVTCKSTFNQYWTLGSWREFGCCDDANAWRKSTKEADKHKIFCH